jgi:hypothetical protein
MRGSRNFGAAFVPQGSQVFKVQNKFEFLFWLRNWKLENGFSSERQCISMKKPIAGKVSNERNSDGGW